MDDDEFWFCRREVEFCPCGRQLVRTVERSGVWHSCPRYLVPAWHVLFGRGGMGHKSHWESNPIRIREWA